MNKALVFISYSHKDEGWKDRLRSHLKILEKHGPIQVWDDRKIDAGDTWYNEIEEAVADAAVSVCMISADYLVSDFVIKEEIPYLLRRREKTGMVLIPILLHECLWEVVPWLNLTQMHPGDGKSVSDDFPGRKANTVFKAVAKQIHEIISDPEYQPPKPTPRWDPPESIDIERLPLTGQELFGRKNELKLLDDAWETEDTHVVSLVASGGIGKSALINKWLESMAEDNFRGARCVFGWTFHSQGAGEQVTSADLFITEALAWFGDPAPGQGSPWDKGQRLADLVRLQKTLLVLDGMEPLQSAFDVERGKIKDPALVVLLTRLARDNDGLCVITTREPVTDLHQYGQKSPSIDLEQISAEAGRALLRVSGVRGNDAELEEATRNFGNHALAINLLGTYLQEIPGHHISNVAEIADLDIPEKQGKHPRRVMVAFAERFEDGPELELLHVLGLFNRPAELEAIDRVKSFPPIRGLTEHLSDLNAATFLKICEQLRSRKLLAAQSRHLPDTLDCHPLVREHFGEDLQKINPEAWREAHSRLYEYYEKLPEKKYTDALAKMEPLFAAVTHGCQAMMHLEVLNDVYAPRIRRWENHYIVRQLGALSADLAALSNFFEAPWTQLVSGLGDAVEASILNWAGYALRGLGRLREAVEPMQLALEIRIAQPVWKQAAQDACNLSEAYLIMGELNHAVDYAQQSVDFADKCGDGFEREVRRATLANAMLQVGNFKKAEQLFLEAEAMQKKRQPEFFYMFSFRGFLFCDLLLSRKQVREVLERAEYGLKIAQSLNMLLNIALDFLSLGRAYYLQMISEGFEASKEPSTTYKIALDFLNKAVESLRHAGQQQYLPLGFFARAALFRTQENFAAGWEDLAAAQEIAERGEMGLYLADYQLEASRLYLAEGKQHEAQEHLKTAAELVEKMGYGRRKPEVEELKEKIGALY